MTSAREQPRGDVARCLPRAARARLDSPQCAPNEPGVPVGWPAEVVTYFEHGAAVAAEGDGSFEAPSTKAQLLVYTLARKSRRVRPAAARICQVCRIRTLALTGTDYRLKLRRRGSVQDLLEALLPCKKSSKV